MITTCNNIGCNKEFNLASYRIKNHKSHYCSVGCKKEDNSFRFTGSVALYIEGRKYENDKNFENRFRLRTYYNAYKALGYSIGKAFEIVVKTD